MGAVRRGAAARLAARCPRSGGAAPLRLTLTLTLTCTLTLTPTLTLTLTLTVSLTVSLTVTVTLTYPNPNPNPNQVLRRCPLAESCPGSGEAGVLPWQVLLIGFGFR